MVLQLLTACPAQGTDLEKTCQGSVLVLVALSSTTVLTYE